MLGHVNHEDVRNVLVRGHIYLNCKPTPVSFCALDVLLCKLQRTNSVQRLWGSGSMCGEHAQVPC